MNGFCDVKGCSNQTFMGWSPRTENKGWQICEYHWCRHKNKQDCFDLYDVFNLRKPVKIQKYYVKTQTKKCSCGRVLLTGHRLCVVCAEDRERERKRQYYHNKKNHHIEPVKESTLQCKQCGGPRLPNHIYCSSCANRRKIVTRRQAQSRYCRK